MLLDSVTCLCLAPALPSKGSTWGETGQVLLKWTQLSKGLRPDSVSWATSLEAFL